MSYVKRGESIRRKVIKEIRLDHFNQVFEKHKGNILTHKEICQIIDARDPNSRQNVFDELNMLVKHGSIERINHFTFKSLGDSQYLEGRIDITQRGAGFVSIDGHERDIYIAPPNTNRALQNDQVKIKIIKEGSSRDEGIVVEVIKRDKVLFVGELRISRKEAVLIPITIEWGGNHNSTIQGKWESMGKKC